MQRLHATAPQATYPDEACWRLKGTDVFIVASPQYGRLVEPVPQFPLSEGVSMVSKELFAAIHADFIESQDFLEHAACYRRGGEFVCHHNSYLVASFLHRRGHVCLQWVTGYYQCREPEKRIHHSWIKLVHNGQTAAILELDPHQLHEAGGYENDLMPSGHIPELSTALSGIASIVEPALVQLSDEARESRWVVASKDILSRYVEFNQVLPDIDFADLDELGGEVAEEYEAFRELMAEDGSE